MVVHHHFYYLIIINFQTLESLRGKESFPGEDLELEWTLVVISYQHVLSESAGTGWALWALVTWGEGSVKWMPLSHCGTPEARGPGARIVWGRQQGDSFPEAALSFPRLAACSCFPFPVARIACLLCCEWLGLDGSFNVWLCKHS